MGIQGLIPMLKPAHTWRDISDYSGKTLAVDAYVWLHKGAFSCAEELVRGKQSPKLVNYCMHRVRLLKYHGVQPYIVFDGGDLPAKLGTEDERAQRRAENLVKANALHDQGRLKEARELYTKCLDVTPELALQFIKALKAENVSFIVAPYEADAQLAYLERMGIVDGIITEDSDLLVFGCKNVLFKMDGDGKCCEIRRDTIGFGDGLGGMGGEFRFDGWGDSEFRHMAILSGCDYIPSISGVGIKTAHKLLRKLKTVEKVLQYLRLGGKEIPTDYRERFRLAELTFLHQRVIDPTTRQLVSLSPLPEGLGDEELRYIGPDLDPAIARGIANGERNPITKVLFVDPWPDYKPVPVRATIKHQPKISDMFQKVPKPTLRHTVSTPTAIASTSRMAFGPGSGSGRQRLSDLSNMSAVARGKLPAKGLASPESDVEDDIRPTESTNTKRSKFFSSSDPSSNAKARARSDRPRPSEPIRRDLSLEDLPTVDDIFEKYRSSTPEDVDSHAEPSSFPPGFENITPPLDKPSTSSAASFVSLSPCAPASPQALLDPEQDQSEIFSSPTSARRFGSRGRGRESSMEGYISSSPAPGETPNRKRKVKGREESLEMVEEADEPGGSQEQNVVGTETVDLKEVCVGTSQGKKRKVARKTSRSEESSSVVASSDGVDEENQDLTDEEGSREDKLAVIAKGWRERFSFSKGPSSSPFNKSSPLLARTSLPTPTRPALLASNNSSAFACTVSTPTNFLASKNNNTPSSIASASRPIKDDRTPTLNKLPSKLVFDSQQQQNPTPRSLPPKFSFAPKPPVATAAAPEGKENAPSSTSSQKRTPLEEIPRSPRRPKQKRRVVDSDDDEDAVVVPGSGSPTRDEASQASVRSKLDRFRFRPKLA